MARQEKKDIEKPIYRSDGTYEEIIEPNPELESWDAAEKPVTEEPDAYEEGKYRRES